MELDWFFAKVFFIFGLTTSHCDGMRCVDSGLPRLGGNVLPSASATVVSYLALYVLACVCSASLMNGFNCGDRFYTIPSVTFPYPVI